MADPAPRAQDGEFDGEEHSRLLAHAKGYLPFLMVVINSDNLDIQNEHKDKLRSLYDMVDARRLSTTKLKSCQNVFCSLYAKYHTVLSEEQLRALNNVRDNVQSSREDNNVSRSLDVESIPNENDQKSNNKSEFPSKMSSSLSVVEDDILNKKQDSLENDSKLDNESTSKKEKFDKVLKYAYSATVDKLNKSDNVSSGSKKFAKEIFDGLKKEDKEIICQRLIKDLNFDDIDVNLVTKAVDSYIHGNNDGIEPPPLPPPEILDLGLSKDLVESNVKPTDSVDNRMISKGLIETPQHTSSSEPSKFSSVREKLKNEVNKIHKIGSLSEPKKKVISSLKPGTLRDLENSKTISSSLHIESLRPTVKSAETFKPVSPRNMNKNEHLLLARDPRRKKNLSSNSVNNINPAQLSSQTNRQILTPIPKVQNCSSESIPSILSMDINPPFLPSTFEPKHQEIMSHCLKNNIPQHEIPRSAYYTGQVFNKLFNGINPSTQNQYGYNRNERNNDSRQNDVHPHYSLNQTYVNSVHNDESKYLKSGSNNCLNDNLPRRDPRLSRSDQKSSDSRFCNYKDYRESKYGKEKSTNRKPVSSVHEPDHYHGRLSEKYKESHTDKTKTDLKINNPYNTLGTISDIAASIKGFKIPKVKRIVDYDKQKHLRIEKVVDNTEKYRRSDTLKVSNSDKNKSETTSYSIADKCKNDKLIKESKSSSYRNNEVIKNSHSDKCKKTEVVKDNYINKELKAVSTDGKTEKCLKTNVTKCKNLEIRKNEATNDTEKDLELESTKDGTKKELITENCSKCVTNDSSSVTEVNTVKTKSKKPKRYSKEREFEKIVKEAVAISKDCDLIGPRTRTRKFLKSNDKTLKKCDTNNYSKHNNDEQNSVSEEGSFDFFEKSHKSNDESKPLDETGLNVISSTSKDPSEIDSLTEVVSSSSQEENMVSSNEINSTADEHSNDNQDLISRKKKLMAYLNKCNIDILSKLLETPQIANIIEDKLDDSSTLHDEKFNAEDKKKSKKKKRKKKKEKNDIVGLINEDNSKDENADLTEGVKTITEESNFNGSSDNLSTNHVIESELMNDKECQPNENFTTLEDKSKFDLINLQVVLHKFDKESNDVTSNVLSTDHQPVHVSQNECDEVTQSVASNSDFETTSKVILNVREYGSKVKKGKSNSKVAYVEKDSCTSPKSLEIYTIKSISSEKLSEDTQSLCEGALIKQSTTETTTIETNVSVNSKNIKKPRSKTRELDKLHAYTSEMYDCDAILNIPNVRHCRTNKSIDYVNTSIVFSKKSNVSRVNQLDSYDHCNYELNNDFDNPKSKSTKKPSKILKKNKSKNPNSSTSESNNILVKKKSYVSPLVNKTKSKSKAKKQLTKKKLKLGVVCISEEPVEVLPKILTENDFKDKSYFQSGDNWLECKFCLYSNGSLNVVRHYVDHHCEEEVLPSRLPKDCAESLINESLKENFGFLNSEDLKSTTCVPVNNVFTCVFCQLVINDIIQFYDHITSHTGEYRYKCKMCEQVYSCASELENHIVEHTDYDKTDGISQLLHSSPTLKVFGYLCSFCYYVQLDYNKIIKHMEMRHNDEDKKFNGHWTVIRVSMSFVNENNENAVIDYTNMVGCLPPMPPNQQACQIISKTHNPEDKIPISQLVVEARKNLIGGNAECILFDEPPQEIQQVTPNLLQQVNLTSREKGSEISIVNFELGYTMKENCQLVTVAELSCVLVDQMLMFKCCVLSCSDRPFSTVDLKEFVKHIEQSHQHTIWDRKCTQCGLKVEKVSEECLVIKDALKHLVSHHLVLKSCEEFNTFPVENVIEEQSASTSCQYNVENVITKKEIPSKTYLRCVPTSSMATHLFIKGTEKNALPAMTNDNLSVSEALSVPDSDINRDVFTAVTNDSFSVNKVLIVPNNKNIDTAKLLNQETMDENIEQVNHIESNNVSEMTGDKTNSNHSNNLGFRIDNIMSLNEGMVVKKRASKNTLSNNNDNLSSESRIIMTYENTKRDFQQKYCERGHFLVNDGKPVDGFSYKLIDTTYNKCYSKQVKDFPLNELKTRMAYNEMTAVPRILDLFKCMDRNCTKIFTRKDLFISHMKSHFSNAEKKNKNQINVTEYFKKCAYCYRTFNNEDSLAEHIAEQYTYCKYFCPYCFYRAYSPTHVFIHIDQTHVYSKHKIMNLEYDENCDESQTEIAKAVDYAKVVLPFICNIGSCKFSCYLSENFTSHLMQEHQQCDKYCCYLCERENYTFFTLQPNKMMDHFKMHGLNKYQCVFCLFGTESPYLMLIHLSMEHFEYNPVCLERAQWDSSNINDLLNLKIIKLTLPIDNGVIETINLPPGNGCLSETLPHKSNKIHYERSDVITAAMKSAHILENVKASDAIVINVPDRAQFTDNTTSTQDISNEFIMLDDVNSFLINKKNTAKVAKSSGSENSVREQKSTDDNSVIIIDDEDDLSSNNDENTKLPAKRKRLGQKSSTVPNKHKKLAWPVISLDNLFYCETCDINLQDSKGYLLHLNTCRHLMLNGRQCPFCTKVFKTDFHITEHIKLHGPERFSCSSCDFKAPSKRAIEHHMRVSHQIKTFDFVPIVGDSCDPEKDEFVVHEDLTNSKKHCIRKSLYSCSMCEFIGNFYSNIASHMKDTHCIDKWEMHVLYDASPSNDYTQQYLVVKSASVVDVSTPPKPNESVKRKHSGDLCDNVLKKKIIDNANTLDKTDGGVTLQHNMLFSPETADDIPMLHIFSQPVGCSLCTYNTKVRSNLILHLKGHEKGQDNTTKEIVNPVPSMGKSDLMFDKMINLSASSMEAERTKIFEMNKKIVEVASENHLNFGTYPQFVNIKERFICSICQGNFLHGDMLKTHILVFHPQFSCYRCPHYPCIRSDKVADLNNIEYHLMLHGENLYACQYCDYLDFNRTKMRTHMRTNHLLQVTSVHQSNIIVIRQTKLEDDNWEKSIHQDQLVETEWICNLCSSGVKYTYNDIKSHISIAHKVSKMFKCPMCQFEHDDNNGKVFEDHYKVEHPSVAVKCLTVYEKVTCVQEQPNQLQCTLNAQNVFEQQALESIEPSIVPPACRGIPVESAGKTMYNKSRVATKSPKATTKSSPVSKQKVLTFTDNFSIDDSLGELSASGKLSCPRCNKYETSDIPSFHYHLCKDVVTKTYKCTNCYEVSDSPQKMAWHVKKHGADSVYERVENADKLRWVDAVIKHQSALMKKLDKTNNKKQGKLLASNKNLNLSLKKINCENKTNSSATTCQIQNNNDVISLLDDSDDE